MLISKDLVPLSFLDLLAEFNHRGPCLLFLRLSSLLYYPSWSLHLVAPALSPSAPVPFPGSLQFINLDSVWTILSPGCFWKPSILALMMTKSVLVPSLSSGLHIQGSSCLLGPPQPPKTLGTMHRTPLPHSQLPLTQHQGVSSTPLPPFPSLQSLNIRSPIIVYIEEPRCPVIICIERAGASTFSSFHRDCVALPPQAPGFVTECVCRSVVSDCLRPHGM